MRGASVPRRCAPDATHGFITRSRGAAEPLHAGDETVTSVLLDMRARRSVSAAASCVHRPPAGSTWISKASSAWSTIRDAIGERPAARLSWRIAASCRCTCGGGTCTAAVLLAAARAGVTVAAPGDEAAVLAPLPLRTLTVLAHEESVASRKSETRSQKTEGERREARARSMKSD